MNKTPKIPSYKIMINNKISIVIPQLKLMALIRMMMVICGNLVHMKINNMMNIMQQDYLIHQYNIENLLLKHIIWKIIMTFICDSRGKCLEYLKIILLVHISTTLIIVNDYQMNMVSMQQ